MSTILCITTPCSEAEVGHLGVSVGGRLLSYLCYADDTALCANNHHEADELISQVNDAGTRRLLKLNVKKKTKLFVINESEKPTLWVTGEPIERVNKLQVPRLNQVLYRLL